MVDPTRHWNGRLKNGETWAAKKLRLWVFLLAQFLLRERPKGPHRTCLGTVKEICRLADRSCARPAQGRIGAIPPILFSLFPVN